jgi:hypothetical protein
LNASRSLALIGAVLAVSLVACSPVTPLANCDGNQVGACQHVFDDKRIAAYEVFVEAQRALHDDALEKLQEVASNATSARPSNVTFIVEPSNNIPTFLATRHRALSMLENALAKAGVPAKETAVISYNGGLVSDTLGPRKPKLVRVRFKMGDRLL